MIWRNLFRIRLRDSMITALARKIFVLFFFYGGIFHLVRFVNNCFGKRVTIVTYHRVTNRPLEDISASLPYLFTTVATFRKHLALFVKWYTIVTFKELKDFADGKKLPWNSLIITFDDGYEDNYLHAFPILSAMNMPATLFVTVGKIGTNGQLYWWDRLYYYFIQLKKQTDRKALPHGLNSGLAELLEQFNANASSLFSRLNTLDSQEIDAMLDDMQKLLNFQHGEAERLNALVSWQHIWEMKDTINIGSHTVNHCNLIHTNSFVREFEIHASKKKIEEKIQQRVYALSYPCGQYNDDVRREVKNAGYEFAVTTEKGVNDLTDRYALKRINIWEDTGLSLTGKFSKGYFAFKLSGL